MLSFWERESLTKYQFIIVGSGIVGIQTAIALRERHPQAQIAILERSVLPYGASSRNAGFACMGSIGELYADLEKQPPAAIADLFQQRYLGIKALRAQFGDTAIGYSNAGSYELLRDTQEYLLDYIGYFNKLLKAVTNEDIFQLDNKPISSMGINTATYTQAIYSNIEGSIDTGKLMRRLLDACQERKIQILTGAQVTHFEDNNNHVTVSISDPIRKDPIRLSCEQLFLCTNAFTGSLLPQADIHPGRGQIILTSPIPNLGLKGVFHMDAGYFYARNIGNRLLLGGGRHLYLETEHTDTIAINKDIISHLESMLSNDLLPHHSFSIEMQWAGIMAFGKNKNPIVSRISTNVYGAYRLGGMGVAIGTHTAQQLAQLSCS